MGIKKGIPFSSLFVLFLNRPIVQRVGLKGWANPVLTLLRSQPPFLCPGGPRRIHFCSAGRVPRDAEAAAGQAADALRERANEVVERGEESLQARRLWRRLVNPHH